LDRRVHTMSSNYREIVQPSPKDLSAVISILMDDAVASFETDPEASRQLLARTEGLRQTVREMCQALSSLLNKEPDTAEAHLRRAESTLQLARRSPGLVITARTAGSELFRGGLGAWKTRLIREHIDTHLDGPVRTNELAKLTRLSSFHFSRVFRVSLGCSPHEYVTRCRIKRAQALMLNSPLSLGQIAIDCGFADQAHFNRQFRKFTGETPGEWRRLRNDGTCTSPSVQQSVRSSAPSSHVFATIPQRNVPRSTDMALIV
jgi:AraC family transcriptional regulator